MAIAEWGPWQPINGSPDVAVSFSQVNTKTWTWAFRNNNQTRTIASFDFQYTYVDADSGLTKTDKDVMPLPLKPGGTLGGWTAFTANTRMPPTIQITKIKYK